MALTTGCVIVVGYVGIRCEIAAIDCELPCPFKEWHESRGLRCSGKDDEAGKMLADAVQVIFG